MHFFLYFLNKSPHAFVGTCVDVCIECEFRFISLHIHPKTCVSCALYIAINCVAFGTQQQQHQLHTQLLKYQMLHMNFNQITTCSAESLFQVLGWGVKIVLTLSMLTNLVFSNLLPEQHWKKNLNLYVINISTLLFALHGTVYSPAHWATEPLSLSTRFSSRMCRTLWLWPAFRPFLLNPEPSFFFGFVYAIRQLCDRPWLCESENVNNKVSSSKTTEKISWRIYN